MKGIKNIFGRIWAAWALVVFFLTMLPALVIMLRCTWLRDPAKAGWQQSVSRVWMRIFFALTGCRRKMIHEALYKKGQNYIVVCNHNSFLDVMVTNPFLPGISKTIAKKSMASIPLFGWIYRWGSVLVDRASELSRRQSYQSMKDVLALGMDMLLFPEGTRNKSGQPLGKFQSGAFRLAIETQTPIIPVVIIGTKKMMPADKSFYFLPGTIELHFLPPVTPDGLTHIQLSRQIFESMWNYYEANY